MKVSSESNAESAWVTLVEKEDDLSRALVLGASLRKVLTSYPLVAIVVGEGLFSDIRDKLITGGYDNVYRVEDNVSFPEALASVVERGKLRNYVFLPVDSIALDNADGEIARFLSDKPSTQENVNVDKNNAFAGISDSEFKPLKQPVYHSVDINVPLKDCLDHIPAIVRLVGVSVDKVCSGQCTPLQGLLEQKILNYWGKLYTSDALPILDGTKASNPDCDMNNEPSWNGEPLAVIGVHELSASLTLSTFLQATKAVLGDAGLTIDLLTKSNNTHFRPVILTSSSTPSALFDLSQFREDSPLKSLDWISESSSSMLFSALKLLRVERKYSLGLLYATDEKGRLALLLLATASHAIKHKMRMHAILGHCTIPNDDITTAGKGESAIKVELSDMAQLVRFMNAQGPIVDKPWLTFRKLHPSDLKESAVITLESTPFVVSTTHADQCQGSYPQITLSSMERSLHCIALPAGNNRQLEKVLVDYHTLLRKAGGGTTTKAFASLAYTTNTLGDSHRSNQLQNHGAVIIAKDCAEACKLLSTNGYLKESSPPLGTGGKQKLCFLFTGQGSQYPDMAKALYESCPVFRVSLDRCNLIFRNKFNVNIHDAIWKDSRELSRTLYSQTAIFCVEYALLQVWNSWGIYPDCVIGHSLGEFAAAVAAGALEFEDALMLVAERSRLIDDLPQGKMLVLRGDQRKIEGLLKEFVRNNPRAWLDFAAINSKDQTVLSGDSKYAEAFSEFCKGKGVPNLVLEATHAFHSRHMDPMLEEYRKVAETCRGDLRPSKCLFISGMDGDTVEGPLDPQYWVRHTKERVRFLEASKTAYFEGCRVFLEIGPQPILSTFVRTNTIQDKSITFLPSLKKGGDDWNTMLNSLAKLWLQGRHVDWVGFEKFFDRNSPVINDELRAGLEELRITTE